jgi:hypothetical protein
MDNALDAESAISLLEVPPFPDVPDILPVSRSREPRYNILVSLHNFCLKDLNLTEITKIPGTYPDIRELRAETE